MDRVVSRSVAVELTTGRVVTNKIQGCQCGTRARFAVRRKDNSVTVKVHALDHLAINVADVARSAEWYRQVLGMEIRVFDPGGGRTPRTSLIFGNQKINV